MPQVRLNHVLTARMIRMLLDEPCTCKDLADETGLRILTVWAFIRALRKEGLVRIAVWERSGASTNVNVRAYKMEPGRDAPRPKPMTNAEACRRYSAARKLRREQMRVINALAGVGE